MAYGFLRACGLSLGAVLALFVRPGLAAQNSGALGQVVPSGGIVAVTGVTGSIMTAVRVRPGDLVKSGDLLMTIFSDSIKADQDLAALDLQGEHGLDAFHRQGLREVPRLV